MNMTKLKRKGVEHVGKWQHQCLYIPLKTRGHISLQGKNIPSISHNFRHMERATRLLEKKMTIPELMLPSWRVLEWSTPRRKQITQA